MALSYAAYGVFILLTINLMTSVSCAATELIVYKEDNKSDMIKLDQWFNVIKDAKNLMNNDKAAMYQLGQESCRNKKSVVCKSFENAKKKQKNWEKICPESGLWIAECYALYMYTDKAHEDLNKAAMNGDFQTYKVSNYLLNCAVRKLSLNKNFQVGNVKIYRCLKTEHTSPKAERVFWKTFTSTSLDKAEACRFGSATIIEFGPKATQYGAKIMKFSMFPGQKEVLIPPFESFDVLKSDAKTPGTIKVKSSTIQKYDLSSICRN